MNIGWTAKKIALCAVMTATLCVFKQALAFIPNVEVVTLLTAVYAYVFGSIVLISVVGFVLVEMAIWGVAVWNIYYLLFWGLVAIIFSALGKREFKNIWLLLLIVACLTFIFGLLSSFFDVCISGFSNFFFRFSIYYLRGVYFYLIHIVSNLIIFIILFKPITYLLSKFKTKFN